MKAHIVKKIDIELKELENWNLYYREAVHTGMTTAIMREGEVPPPSTQLYREIVYELQRIQNPETNEVKNYFVNVDDRKLWNEIIAVSDGFINSKIEQGVQRFRGNFLDYEMPKYERKAIEKGIKMAGERFLALPWYKRIFYKPKKPTLSYD